MGVASGSWCVALVLAGATVGCAIGGGPTIAAPEPSPSPNRFGRTQDPGPQVVFFPRIGNPDDDEHGAVGPGLALLGGGVQPVSAFVWMHDTVNRAAVAADVVVLCTLGDDVYTEAVYAAAPFNSVQTILVPLGASAHDVALVAQRLATAEIVFLADSEAATFADWKDGAIAAAIAGVFDRGGVVAGSGAGAAALGGAVFVPPGGQDVDSATALGNPYAPSIALAHGPFVLWPLTGVVVDLRLRSADHFGRLAALTARALADGLLDVRPELALGIGLDDHAAVVIDREGRASLIDDTGASKGDAWWVGGTPADRIARGEPLVWHAANVTRFDAPGELYDRQDGCGTAFSYPIAIDGSASPPLTPADPYDAQGTSSPCP